MENAAWRKVFDEMFMCCVRRKSAHLIEIDVDGMNMLFIIN